MRLASLDLNLLLVLDALLETRNVTLAATRLGLTQPAVSNALGRLRVALEDPLFIRASRGLVPTPRAESIRTPLRRAMQDLQGALADTEVFEPTTSHRRFKLATTDYAEMVLLPPLLGLLAQQAPLVDLEMLPIQAHPLDSLAGSDVDLALGVFTTDHPGLVLDPLFTEPFACAVRHGHPLAGRLDLDNYCRLSHVLVAPRGNAGSTVDTALRALGRARRVAVRVPHFLMAPMVVAQSDMVVTLPRRVLEQFADRLHVTDPPVDLPPIITRLAWHPRHRRDAGHRWLRTRISAALRMPRGRRIPRVTLAAAAASA